MAGVTKAPGNFEQLRLVGWLRWRLFVNGLRTATGKLNLAVQIIMGAGIGLGVVVFGVLLGVGSWNAVRYGRPALLAGGLWFVFLVWLLFPLFITGFGAESDPASLLRFPVRFSTFVLLAFCHGLFDPVAAAALYWLFAMLVGIAVASLSALAWAVPAFAALALVNLLLNRNIYAWLSRWMAQRRTREILGAAGVLLALSAQLIRPLAQHFGKRALPWMSRLGTASQFLPPGVTAVTITLGGAGHAGRARLDFAGLLAYCGVLAWLLAIRLRAEYRGENLSETRRPSLEAPSTVRAGWNVTGVSPTVAALFEKDLRYLLRNTMAYLNLLTPVVIILMLSMSMGRHSSSHPKGMGFMLSSSSYFPFGVVYVFLTIMGMVYNNMAYDGSGLPMLFAAPIRFRDVMVAKNLLTTITLIVDIILVFVVIQIVSGPTPPAVVGLTLSAALWALLINLTAGNLSSLYFPAKLKPGRMQRQRGSGSASLISLGVQVVVSSVAALLYFLSRWAGNMAWCAVGLLVLSGITWFVYRHVLNLSSDIAWRRREALLGELTRPD